MSTAGLALSGGGGAVSQDASWLRRLLAGDGLVIALGLLCGASSVLESWLPLGVFGAVALLYASLRRPSIPVTLAFCGIILDARGVTELKLFGLPLTVSKMMVMYAVGSHFVHALAGRSALLRWMPVTAPLAAVILSMITSLLTSVMPSMGYTDIAGVVMLTLMAHVIYTSIPRGDLPWMLRFMSLVTILVLAWTLFTQRAQGFYVTLDHAWQQRTSGGYGDPNAWSTCLVVVCPILIAWTARDKHWSALPILLGLLAAYPLTILQSMSRAGLLAFVLTLPGLAYILRNRTWILVAAALGVLIIVPMTVNIDAMLLRYQTLMDPTLEADLGHGSLRERRGLLEAGLAIFMQHPVTGVGVGMFRMYAAYVSAGAVWKIAHNTYVNVMAEQGLPGVLSHGFLIATLVGAAWNSWRHAHTEDERAFGLGVCISLGAFGAMAFTLNLATFAVAWYMLAVALVYARYAGAEESPDRLQKALDATAATRRGTSSPAVTPAPHGTAWENA